MSEPTNPVQLFSELLGSPLGELISSVGQGVGDAQAALDQGALEQTLEIYDLSKDATRPDEELKLLKLIREIGYQPTFYTIPSTEVEAQISLSLDLKSQQTTPIGGTPLSKFAVRATPLNAGNVNRFGIQANAMAKLKFTIVPVPPPQNVAEIRNVPAITQWNQTNKDLVQSLGFSYIFKTQENDEFTDETLVEGLTIMSQVPAAGTIANTATTPLELKFALIKKVPDVVGKIWNADTREIIQDPGFAYELRGTDGTLITDENDALGLPVTAQALAAGTFVNIIGSLIVITINTEA